MDNYTNASINADYEKHLRIKALNTAKIFLEKYDNIYGILI